MKMHLVLSLAAACLAAPVSASETPQPLPENIPIVEFAPQILKFDVVNHIPVPRVATFKATLPDHVSTVSKL